MRDPAPGGTALCRRGLLHAVTVATGSLVSHVTIDIRAGWRLFEVEPRDAVVTDDAHPTLCGCRAWKVVRELDRHEALGPQGRELMAFIGALERLTAREWERLVAAWDAAWDATRYAAWSAAWSAARDAAWYAARDAAWDATRYAAWSATRYAAWSATSDAALALVVRDLIAPAEFDALYAPFADVIPVGSLLKKESE
ncbi:MAG: hypothetical protein M0Z69_04035 [Actinomycetota bacterium]|nr:hypothetical protein [Actinomycetota bacterium]